MNIIEYDRSQFLVGERIYVVALNRNDKYWETIVRVGRQYIETDGNKLFLISNLKQKPDQNGRSYHQAYLFAETYLREIELRKLWSAFQRIVSSTSRPPTDASELKSAFQILGFPLPP